MYNEFNYKPAPHRERQPVYSCKLESKKMQELFSLCGDFEERRVSFGLRDNVYLYVCWLDGIISSSDAAESILRPLTEYARARAVPDEKSCVAVLQSGGVYCAAIKRRTTMDDTIEDITHGRCVVIFDKLNLALTFEVRSDKTRSVSEPTLEKSVKGAKDSFVETLRVNTSLVRRRICNPTLKSVESTIGRKSNTRVSIMFVDGLADPKKITELAARLDKIDIDGLTATGALEEYIVDRPRSPFPQLIHTERPDRFAMYLLDGRIGILVDGLPIGLVLPVTFAEFLKVTGDSNLHFIVASGLTIVRYLALILALMLPAFYVSVAMYHQEMLPTELLLSIISAKQDVPFSTATEVVSMLIAFSLLQEAGLRLPNPVGDTVSIIGALIVGQSAVDARLVSPIAIIVVAVSGIACYTMPSQDMGYAVRIVRLALLIAGILAGLYGVAVVCCLLFLHLAEIDSFGVNYTAPVSDGQPGGVAKLLLRPPKPRNKFRDPVLKTPDRRRQK